MNNSLHVVQADLESIYSEVKDAKSDQNFFNACAFYGKYLLDNKLIHPILDELHASSKKTVTRYNRIVKEFYEEWKFLADKIVTLAEKYGLEDNPNDPFSFELNALKSDLSEGIPHTSEDYVSIYYKNYKAIVDRFIKAKLEDKIKPDHISKSNFINLYPLYSKVNDEWEHFKQQREQEVWWAHYQIERLTVGVYFAIEGRDSYFTKNRIIDGLYKFEFEKISKGDSSTLIFVHRAKFVIWITRLHKFLVPRLQDYSKYKGFEVKEQKKYETQSEPIKTIRIGDLVVNIGKCKFRYKQNKSEDLNIENKEIKFLLCLIKANGEVVRYKEIADETIPNSYIKGEEIDINTRTGVQTINKTLRKLLKKGGMSLQEIDKYIIAIPRTGYKLGFAVESIDEEIT